MSSCGETENNNHLRIPCRSSAGHVGGHTGRRPAGLEHNHRDGQDDDDDLSATCSQTTSSSQMIPTRVPNGQLTSSGRIFRLYSELVANRQGNVLANRLDLISGGRSEQSHN